MAVSKSFLVLAVELDTGPLFIADRSGALGLDVLVPALLESISASADGCTATLEASALPPETVGAFWSNRDAAILEVSPNMGSVYDGRIIFDGLIKAEPDETAGILSLSLAPRQHRIVSLPNAGVIDAATYPLASADAAGQHKPIIFGSLESCPLLALRLPPSSVLSASAYPGDVSIAVESTADFDDVGAVWVGDSPIQYTSKTDTTLNGLKVAAELIKGTPVVKAGSATFMAAAHPVAILAPQASGHAVTDGTLNSEGLLFPHRPLVTTSGTAMNYLAQFDQVSTGANTISADVTYPVAETITASARAGVTAVAAKTLVTTHAPVASSVVEPATQQTITQAIPYTVTDWTIYAPQAYSNYAYTLWAVTLSGSVTIAAPAGAEVDVTLNRSDSAFDGFLMDNYWTPTAARVDRVNGTISDGSTRLTSPGNVTISSEIILIIGIHANQPQAAFTVVRTQLERGMSLDAILNGRMLSWTRISALSTPSVLLSWRKSAVTHTVMTQPPPTTVTTPAVVGVPARESASVATIGNLNVSLLPPSSITAGNYTFSVFVNTQQRGDLTNPAPVYTATLGGVSFDVPKAGGTVNVVVPVTPGVPVNLVHTLEHSDVDMSGLIDTIFNGKPDDLPPGTFTSAIGLIVPQIGSIGVTWSNATITSPALNPVNAIRAITGNVTHNAVGWDTSIASTGQGNIVFPRPSADRIVSGYTTVSYTVNLNGYTGAVGVSIGGQNVYYADGGNPAYYWTPCTVQTDDDADLVPVVQTGGIGIVTLSIISASRTVLTGNIDGGKYATLRHPSNTRFRAVQLDQMPPRGRFKKARLFVEWFMAGIKGAAVPNVKVTFGGQLRGALNLVAPAGSTTSKTVSVDSASAGNVTIPALTVPQAVSGNVGALAHTAIPQTAMISALLVPISGDWAAVVQRGWALCPKFPGLTGYVTAKVNFVAATATDAADPFLNVTFRRADGSAISTIQNINGGFTNVATNTYQASITLAEAPVSIFCERTSTKLVTVSSITFEWNATIASTSVSQTNSLSVGAQRPTNATATSGPSVSVTLGNNAISVTVPDAPRTTVTEFTLAEITDWRQLTGQVCEIEYTAGVATLDVHLVQVQVAIDYDDETRLAVGDADAPISAGVIGLSGNPADVLLYLANATGQALDVQAVRRLRDWCNANAYVFARRLSDPIDSLTLLTYAADQAGVILAKRGDVLAPIRWFDLGGDVIPIKEEDCLQAAQIGWAERVETSITLNYREDLTGSAGFTKTILATATNNAHCRKGLAAIKIDNPVTLEAGWLRDPTPAAQYLAYYARRYGQARRVLSLALPHTYNALQEGDLIRFTRLGQSIAESITARITSVSNDDGWPSIAAEQILD